MTHFGWEGHYGCWLLAVAGVDDVDGFLIIMIFLFIHVLTYSFYFFT